MTNGEEGRKKRVDRLRTERGQERRRRKGSEEKEDRKRDGEGEGRTSR